MIPKEAIEKAIEGGWTAFGHCSPECITPASFILTNNTITFYEGEYTDEGAAEYDIEKVALDPSFWKSLGKALGWGKGKYCGDAECGNEGQHYHQVFESTWHQRAHRFYDIILQNGGNGTKAFWDDLLGV